MARAITLTGQYIIKTVGDGLNNDLGKMFNIKDYDWSFYSDTDSCYITLAPMVEKYYKDVSDEKLVSIIDKIAKEKITPIINKHCLDLQTYTNTYRNMISFKQESISKNGVFCCHPDTTIVINENITTISDLYDISLDGIVDSVILSYDVFNSIFECDIVEEVLRRDYSGYMYEFYLENGECLKVTSEHIIIVNRCGINCEVKAKDILESDEFIGI